MLKKYFEAEGYNALTSDTGSLAFKIANLEKPEVVLSEVFLPDMDGIELCKRIRDISVIPDVPYVFLSSVSDFLIENKAFRAGADEFLVKNNTTRQELLLRIELLLHQNVTQQKSCLNRTSPKLYLMAILILCWTICCMTSEAAQLRPMSTAVCMV